MIVLAVSVPYEEVAVEELVLVETVKQLEELHEYLKDKDFIAFDTETTGITRQDKIIGFSVCAELDKAYYVVISYWNPTISKMEYTEVSKGNYVLSLLIFLSSKDLIMQNAVFDCAMVEANYNVNLIHKVHTDTLILGHLLNENRSNGLKERALELFGEESVAEQKAMKESISKNGGVITKDKYELYKADKDLIGYYGAKDAILTLKLFYHDVPLLYEQGLDKFFYEEESMPLLRGPTYELNTSGLRVDPVRIQELKSQLEADLLEAKAYILNEVQKHISDYPTDKKKFEFNIGSSNQLAWLLFYKLDNDFTTLTDVGKEVCHTLSLRIPYNKADKRAFIETCNLRLGEEWKESVHNKKTGKDVKPKKIENPWKYMQCNEEALSKYAHKYKWVARLLEYKKNLKILNTYVEGIQERAVYNVIRPSFLQHGTTSGRYSSKNPNFQNLPREDKRVKACIVARPGNVFIGADYSQLEPRVFASLSKDDRLLKCFKNKEDFYSVIGVEVFDKKDCSLIKNDHNSFAKQYPEERQTSKTIALAATYGASAARLAKITGKPIKEMEGILNAYFNKFPHVREMMFEAHKQVKTKGEVQSLFGRPRRLPRALEIEKLCGDVEADTLPYDYRNILNLSVNHKMQSSGASIMNRAAIAINRAIKEMEKEDTSWVNVKIVMQIHDELVLEGPEKLSEEIAALVKYCMENTVELPGVDLIAEPKIAYNLADLK